MAKKRYAGTQAISKISMMYISITLTYIDMFYIHTVQYTLYYVYCILSRVGTHITQSILLHIMFILTIKIRRIHGLWEYGIYFKQK